jgi:hypothetical protein
MYLSLLIMINPIIFPRTRTSIGRCHRVGTPACFVVCPRANKRACVRFAPSVVLASKS